MKPPLLTDEQRLGMREALRFIAAKRRQIQATRDGSQFTGEVSEPRPYAESAVGMPREIRRGK